MGFTIERNGLVSVQSLFTSMINDMANNGFDVKYHNGTSGYTDATEATLEVTGDTDPLYVTQPWRIKLTGLVPGGSVMVGTPLQLPNDGSSYERDGTVIPAGRTALNPDIIGIIDGTMDPTTINPASPYSYRISITERGFAFEAWQNANEDERNWWMMCIQRLVNPLTGKIYIEGHSPVMCLYTINDGGTFHRITVREDDVLAPGESILASDDTDYVGAVINPKKQITIAETNQYFVICPAGFNTHRHLYNEEMDIVTYTSAGVLSHFNDARINMYGHGSLDYTGKTGDMNIDSEIVGVTSGARGFIRSTVTDVSGTVLLHSIRGEFQSGEQLRIDGVAVASASANSVLEYRKYKGGCANVNNAEGVRVLFLIENGGI